MREKAVAQAAAKAKAAAEVRTVRRKGLGAFEMMENAGTTSPGGDVICTRPVYLV